MFSRALRYVVLPIFIISCATSNTSRISERTQRQQIRTLSSTELTEKIRDLASTKSAPYTQYQARYLLAMKLRTSDALKSCAEFIALAQDTDFWAKTLAKLRMYEVCLEGAVTNTDIEEIKSTDWYKYEFLKTATYTAIRAQDLEKEMRFGFDFSLAQTRKKEKIQLLQRSIEIAKMLGRKTEEILYLESLYRAAPRLRPNPSVNDYLVVADDFKNARDFTVARKYYELIFGDKKLSFEERYKALDGISKSYKIQGAKAEYLKSLDRQSKFATAFWKLTPKDKALMKKVEEAYTTQARAQWTEQQTTQALVTLTALEKLLKGKDGLDQIFWVRGRIEEEAGNYDRALDWMAQALNQPGLEIALKETIMWQQAWLLRKSAKLSESRDAFQKLKETAVSPFAKTKYAFWYSVILQETGDAVSANNELETITKTDPFSYYSLMSHKKLLKKLKLSDLTSPNSTAAIIPANFDDNLFSWLVDVNEVEIARSYLEKYLSQNPSQSTQLLKHMALVGLFNRMYTELGVMDFDTRNQFIREHLEFFFPRSFKTDYEIASKQTGVDESLLMAITRQESGFDPYSRSPADAFGLMQLLPEVGQVYAKKLGLTYNVAEDLYNPGINIPIGAHLILNQFDRFNGAFVPAIASYNASEVAVRGWIKTRYKGDPVSFIEEVPYEETKAYIKLVMRNNVFYKLLNSPNGEIDFPENLLTVIAP